MIPLRIFFSLIFLYMCLFYSVAVKEIYYIIEHNHADSYLQSMSWCLGIHLFFVFLTALFLFKKTQGMDEKRVQRHAILTGIFFALFILSGFMVVLSLPHA